MSNAPLGTFSTEGIDILLKDIDKYEERIIVAVANELRASVQQINRNQKAKALGGVPGRRSGGTGRSVAPGIGYTERGRLQYELVSTSEISAFEEFGTKSRVQVPEGLEDVAITFKGMQLGSKLKAQEAIYAWCKRAGISKKYWFVVYIRIMRFGRRAKPFFFAPYEVEIVLLEKRIKEILDTV